MPFLELLNELMPAAERMRWEAALARRAREYGRNDDLVREGAAPEKLHIVLAGWAQRYKQMEDGRRQILGFILPGEVCNLDLFTLMRADHSIAAVRTLTVAEFDREEVESLLADCPHLGQALCLSEIIAKSRQHEWILSLGQRSAVERVAHLLAETFERERLRGRIRKQTCDFPPTQAQIAEAVGLTPVHVNRMLTELRRGQGVEIANRRLFVPDFAALARLAAFDARYLHGGEARQSLSHAAALFRAKDAAGVPARLPPLVASRRELRTSGSRTLAQ
jgi:CRP-like cAMP-binding protein